MQTQTGPARATIERVIDWSDTDASGHWHFSTACRLAEAAEAALFTRLGIAQDVFGRTPRVSFSADYRSVARFGDVVVVDLEVAAVGGSSITLAFTIRRDADVIAEGRMVEVLLDRAEGAAQRWPDAWRAQLLGATSEEG